MALCPPVLPLSPESRHREGLWGAWGIWGAAGVLDECGQVPGLGSESLDLGVSGDSGAGPSHPRVLGLRVHLCTGQAAPTLRSLLWPSIKQGPHLSGHWGLPQSGECWAGSPLVSREWPRASGCLVGAVEEHGSAVPGAPWASCPQPGQLTPRGAFHHPTPPPPLECWCRMWVWLPHPDHHPFGAGDLRAQDLLMSEVEALSLGDCWGHPGEVLCFPGRTEQELGLELFVLLSQRPVPGAGQLLVPNTHPQSSESTGAAWGQGRLVQGVPRSGPRVALLTRRQPDTGQRVVHGDGHAALPGLAVRNLRRPQA